MKMKQKPVAAAVSLALAGAWPAFAQQAPAPDQPAAKETVSVTGIRASIEKSLETKKNADTVTEVITAEDIGKLPDKNIADAVQRLPGVTTSSSAGGEGGFDENDRVSLRGTNPSLTQTTINGHMVSSGDWFVLDQVTTVGRSVSFTMLPSELVSQVIVRKTQTADMVEGGVAGNVDIITRKPLQFAKPVTVSGSIGAVYADLPKKTDPQASVLINWKNDANNFGVMLQGFYEERHLRRDGQEILGYGTIDPASSLAQARPDLAGVAYPTLIGSALFEQKRERKGGLLGLQFEPIRDLSLGFETFQSRLDATNYNRNWMMWGSKIIGTDNRVPSSYTVNNGTLVAANWPNAGTAGSNAQYAIVDQIYRPGSYSESSYSNLDGSWHLNDRLTLTGQLGITRGKGVTPVQDVFEGDVFNTGAVYNMHGIGSPVDVAFPSGNPSNFNGTSLDWIFGSSPASTEDKERYGKADAEWLNDRGYLRSVKGGLRYAEHTRETHQVAQGPNFALNPFDPANLPAWSGQTYPGNFGNGLGGNFPRNVWMLDPGVLQAWGDQYSNRDPVSRQYWPGEFALKEKDSAAYVMGNFEGTGWSGNAGLRFVKTREDVTVNVGVPGAVCAPQSPCPQFPGAITTSAFGTFYKDVVSNTYNDVLPSANLRWDLGRNMVGRLAATRVMSRPDYSALGGSITADDTTHTGNGGNPNLKPIVSNNLDASWEWYFAPRALVSAALFYMDLKDYVGFGVHPQELFNIRTGTFDTYQISSPVNSSGTVKGIELAWYQPLGMGFGFEANYTYANAKEDRNCAAGDISCNGSDALVGASKNTYNATAYWENYGFSARLAYTYRSAFFVGLDRSTPEFQDNTGTLAASLGYQITKRFAIYFDALNLNNPTLKYYAANTDQPRAFYKNGRQYYLSLRVAL